MNNKYQMHRKSNSLSKYLKVITILSFLFTSIKLAFMGRLSPELAGVLIVSVVIVLALNKKVLYSLLVIFGFYLFVKLNSSSAEAERMAFTSLIALGIVLLIIYKMIKKLFI